MGIRVIITRIHQLDMVTMAAATMVVAMVMDTVIVVGAVIEDMEVME